MYTRQEIINEIWKNFIVDKRKQSTNGRDRCLYSGTYNGVGCAVGCLIEDDDAELFDNLLYGSGIEQVRNSYPSSYAKYFDVNDVHFLRELQMWHDDWDLDQDKLEEIIENYDLVIPGECNVH